MQVTLARFYKVENDPKMYNVCVSCSFSPVVVINDIFSSEDSVVSP